VDAGLLADARRGLEAARALGRLCIGQTVVVKAGAVVAVEAMEGTDETIRRGLALAGPGASVVKAPAPGHDYRFDVPAIGPDTVARCAAGQARILAVEAERVLLLDLETVATEASRAGLTVIGLGETAGARPDRLPGVQFPSRAARPAPRCARRLLRAPPALGVAPGPRAHDGPRREPGPGRLPVRSRAVPGVGGARGVRRPSHSRRSA